jgi:PAS domain S-box-containing protein
VTVQTTQPDETLSLRRCVRELAALSTLSAAWSRSDPREIANGFAHVLCRALPVAFVYVRVSGPVGKPALEVARTPRGPTPAQQVHEIGQELESLLKTGNPDQILAIANPFGSGTLRLAIMPLGCDGDWGVLVAGSPQVDFPDETDRLLLGVAVNQAAVVLQRRQAEEVLHRSERELGDFFENATVGLHWIDPDGIILRVNQAELDLLGYRREEYVGRHIAEFHVDEPVIKDILARLARGERLNDYPARMRCKDGSIRDVLIDSSVYFENGKFVHTRCFTHDITARKRAEETLRESEERFRFMAESMPQKVFTATPDGQRDYFNPQWFEYTGASFEQVKNWGWTQFLHPDDKEETLRRWKHSIETGQPFEFQNRYRRADGEYRWHLSRARAMRDAEGKVRLWIGSNTDINDQKRAEEWLENTVAERTEELRQANAALLRDMEARKKLEEQLLQAQKMEGIGTLAGGIAHDFNNILNIIQGYTFILRGHGSHNRQMEENLTVINETVQRGTALIQQLLTLARKSSTELESVNANALIEGVIALVTQTFAKTIEWSCELEADLPPITADKNHIEQALLNLCVNARDAMPNGGKLIFKTQSVDGAGLQHWGEATEERYVCIAVSDTGTGMDESIQKRIFEPFFTTKNEGQGTGLGLSVVYGIVKNHNGFIDVESRPMSGTSFRLYFPIAPSEASTKKRVVTRDTEITKPSNGSATVLLVDDEEHMLYVLEKTLLKHGYRVLKASDGESAITTYQGHKQSIDAVLLDLGLPKVAGRDVLLRLKDENPDLKVIISSGYLEPSLKSEIDLVGVKHFLHKPYMPDEAVRTLQSLIESES